MVNRSAPSSRRKRAIRSCRSRIWFSCACSLRSACSSIAAASCSSTIWTFSLFQSGIRLLARGAPVDARNLAGSTALYFAAERGHAAIVQRLIDHGADVNLAGRSGASPVAAAAYAGRDMVVRMLLAHGADGRKADDTGKPPVVYAAAGGQLGIVKQLLALDIDVNARYANDLTLLMWAAGPDEAVAEAQALEVVSYLLDAGARVDERDARGRTALMIAAEGNHPAIAKALLAHGADAALADKAGKHAADLTILSALRAELTPR